MSPLRALSCSARAIVSLAVVLAAVSACGEDSQTAPDKCKDPALPIFDIQLAGAPSVDNPCVTKPGYAISGITTDAGGSSSSGGKGGSGGTGG
jgi:hypothetical protein